MVQTGHAAVMAAPASGAVLRSFCGRVLGWETKSIPHLSFRATARVRGFQKCTTDLMAGPFFPLYNYLCFSLLLFVLVIQLYFQ
jgi:hypothetical protein